MRILQICGAKAAGGAEAFFVRFVNALSKKADVIPVVRKKSWIADELHKNGIEFHSLPFGGLFDWQSQIGLRRILASTQPDIAQAWLNRANRLLPALDIPTLGRLGGYYSLKYYRHRDYLVGNTEDIKQYLIQEGWPAAKCGSIGNFVALPPQDYRHQRQSQRDRYGLPQEATLLFAAGRLHENKAFDSAIRGLALLPDSCHLMIAGQGPEAQKLQQLAQDLDVAARCHFPGWVNPITPLCAAADLFLVPSRHEPLGNVVLDGWAHQLPVIAAASQGPCQLISPGHNGWLFPIDDVQAFAQTVASALSTPETMAKIAQAGFATLQAEHGEEKVIDAYLKLYTDLTKTSGKVCVP